MTEQEDRNWDELVDAALERVAWKVIERAERTGTPVIGWEDGRVVELSPQTVRERLQARPQNGRHAATPELNVPEPRDHQELGRNPLTK